MVMLLAGASALLYVTPAPAPGVSDVGGTFGIAEAGSAAVAAKAGIGSGTRVTLRTGEVKSTADAVWIAVWAKSRACAAMASLRAAGKAAGKAEKAEAMLAMLALLLLSEHAAEGCGDACCACVGVSGLDEVGVCGGV